MPNDYDSLVNANDYDALIQDDKTQARQRLRLSVVPAVQQNPDEYAQAKSLSKTTGVPAQVVARNLPEMSQRAKVNEYDALLDTSPVTAAQMSDRDFASVAHDDTQNLSLIEQVVKAYKARSKPEPDIRIGTSAEFSALVKDIQDRANVDADTARLMASNRMVVNNDSSGVRNSPKGPVADLGNVQIGLLKALPQGLAALRENVRMMFADAIGSDEMYANAAMKLRQQQGVEERTTPQFRSQDAQALYSGVVSMAQQTPGIVASVMTGTAVPALATAGILSGGQAYGKYRERGAGGGQAALGATLEGAIEIGTEVMPMSFLTKYMGKAGAVKFLTGYLGKELPSEIAATIGQNAVDTAIANPDKTWVDYAAEIPEAIRQTAFATLGGVGAMHGVHVALKKITGNADMAVSAHEDMQKVADLLVAASTSKLRERDPESFRNFVTAAAADGGVPHVYVDAEVLQATLQQAGINKTTFAQMMPTAAAQMDESLANGGDVTIPLGELAAGAPGTGLEKTLLEHLRTDPDAPSAAEATVFFQKQADQFQKEAEKIAESSEFTTAFKQSAATVEKELTAQLATANRFTSDVNQQYAKVLASFYTVQAARLGITPEEMYVKYPIQIKAELPAATGRMMKQESFPTFVKTDAGPTLTHNDTHIVEPQAWNQEGGTTHYEHVVNNAEGEPRALLSLGWKNGQVTELHNIRTLSGQREQGVGSSILRAILMHNNASTELHIRHIVPEARRWWLNRGAEIFKTEEGEDGILTREAFDKAEQQRNRGNARKAGSQGQDIGGGYAQNQQFAWGDGNPGIAAAQASAATVAEGAQKLIGLPDKPMLVAGEWYAPGPYGVAHAAAKTYMEDAGEPYAPPRHFARVDVNRAARIAAEFEKMKHAPNDPEVKAAYNAMIDETLAQWQAIKATGLKVEFIDFAKQGDPYAASPRAAIQDVIDNNHLWVFPTEGGFGSDATDISGNPLLNKTDEVIDGRTLLANDVFRIVHDYFGHIKDGNGFRADGEENAWRSHAAMYSPLARRAMTSETRGQNSWVNFGPYGAANRTASAGDTHYAPQKIGLLPEWVSDEGRTEYGQSQVPLPTYGTPKPGSVSVIGVHFSTATRSTLNSAMYGTGMKDAAFTSVMGSEDPAIKERIYFYVSEGNGIRPESGVGAVGHAVRLNNLYDAAADPLGLWKGAGRDPVKSESAVAAAGFDGYYARGVMGGYAGAVVLLGNHNVPVTKLGFKADVNAVVGAELPRVYTQGAVVESPAFKKWFGDSKVTLSDGKTPLRVLHGTSSETMEIFEGRRDLRSTFQKVSDALKNAGVLSFKHKSLYDELFGSQDALDALYKGPLPVLNSLTKNATWFTSRRELASAYASANRGQDAAPNVIPAYLKIERPIILDMWTGDLTHADGTVDVKALEPFGGNWHITNRLGLALAKRENADGVIIKNGTDAVTSDVSGLKADIFIVFSPTQVKSAIGNQGTFDPNNPSILKQNTAENRGEISFGADITASPTVITLLQNADLSTFLHEMGHFQLEVLTHMASQPNAPPEIVDDVNALLKWFGVQDLATWQSLDTEAKREFHEKFARGFEAYLFEGRSPNAEINGVFARFRAWVVAVYRQITALNVELTDEVRGVMNRLIATEDQISAAEAARGYAPLFKTKPDGMTDVEWERYQGLAAESTQEAVEQLQSRSLRDMLRTSNARTRVLKALQKDAAVKRKAIHAEVSTEVNAEPVYAAQRFMKYGELPDGTKAVGAKMSLTALKETYGEGPAAPWRYFNTGKYGLVTTDTEGALTPDQLAEMFGFSSGDELVRKILAADPASVKIEAQTDQRMLERYGDLSSPDQMQRAADAAIHNDARARSVATEYKALSQAVSPIRAIIAGAKEAAQKAIAQKKIKDIRPGQYTASEGRSARAANKASDLVEKKTHKLNQLLNGQLAREAQEVLDQIERDVAYLKRVGDSKTIDPAYREQIDVLLDRFDLRKLPADTAQRRANLLEWVEQQRNNGFEPVIDDALLDEARRTPYRELTPEEWTGLVDAVKNIEHLGRLKTKLLNAKDKREFAAIVESATDAINTNAKRTVPVRLERNSWTARMKEGATEFFAMHRKFASMIREMDGYDDNGVLWDLFTRPMNDAGNHEAVLREQATLKLSALLEPILKEGKLGGKGMFIPEVNASLTREGRIMIALNTGNEGNLQRLMDGDHWTLDQVSAITKTLTKEEWRFVENVWKMIDEYRPLIGAQQKAITGVEPKWVQAVPVVTQHGTFSGGYLPVKYDTTRSTRALSYEASTNVMDMWRAKRGSAKTRDSFTKARAAAVVDRPIRKDFGVITQHLTEVTHRLAWQEYLIDSQRLLRASAIDNAVRDHYGPEALKVLRDTLEDIAAGEVGAQNAFESAINYLRTGATIAGLGWRVTTSLLQPFGLTQSMVRIGPKWVARGVIDWLGDAAKMENTAAKIFQKSDMMRLRAKTMQREISEIRNKVAGRDSAIEASYFYLIQKLQMVADIPTWLGQYHKAVDAGANEDTAVAQADQAVLDAQGGGQIKDLAKIQRGGPLLKLFTNFYSFFNTTWNLSVESVGRTDFKSPTAIGLLAVDFLLLYSVPAALGTFLKAALHAGGGGDDEKKLVRQLISDQLTYLFGTIVGLREVAGALQTTLGLPGDYQGPASVRVFAELAKLGKQVGQGELDEALLKAAANTGGILFHLPSGQVTATASGIAALAEGRTENPGALLVGGPPKH